MPVLDLSAYKPVPATLEDANQIANGFTAIQTCINGLDNNNFAAGKIFDPLKLMQDAATPGQALLWSAAANGGTGGWVPGSASPAVYRKNTLKSVFNTTATTDLLNGEITIGAGILPATGIMRVKAWGTMQNNSGLIGTLRWQLVLGGVTLLDTNLIAAVWQANAATIPWRLEATISAQNATNSQFCEIDLRAVEISGGAGASNLLTGNGLFESRAPIGGFSFITCQGYNTTAIDMTAARALQLNVINPAASAVVGCNLYGATVEIL